MERRARISIALRLADGVSPAFKDSLEISLDCSVCRRAHRTVILSLGSTKGVCTPTGHPFSGAILVKRVNDQPGGEQVSYEIAYDHEDFIDSKYPETVPTGLVAWVRASFAIKCPTCHRSQDGSTQSNLVRPYDERCACGRRLYEDTEPPRISTMQGA
jgi:hypothetical protein